MQGDGEIPTAYAALDVAGRSLHLLRQQPAVEGSAKQPPVLLLHGSTLPGSIAYTLRFEGRSWLDDLSSRGRDAWSLDVRGYGQSWQPADTGERPCPPVADTAQAVEDVGAALQLLRSETGADAVDLVGWSWGATVAACAASAGLPVRRLVLHAPQWLRDTPSPMVTPQSMSEPYRNVDGSAFAAAWARRLPEAERPKAEGWSDMLAAALAEAAPIRVPNGSARDIAVQWMAGRPAYDPAAVRCPTLVVVGAVDSDTPPALARAVFDRLGSGEKFYAEVPGGTHFTPLEPARARLFDLVANFLTTDDLSAGAIAA